MATQLTAASHEVVLDIGSLPVRLRVEDESFRALLCDRYAGFLGRPSSAAMSLEVEIVPAVPLGDGDIEARVRGGKWFIQRADFSAEFDPSTNQGRIRQSANPYSIDTALRILHGFKLAGEGGFLLHAASAVRNGKAFIFTGLSGAGKTTISSLAPAGATLLTDEISYVRRESGRYIACGTPFAGELARLGANVSAPIDSVFLLAKGPQNRIDPVETPVALQRILRNILFFADDPAMVSQVFESACSFCEAVPVRRLTFYPDARVWDIIQ